MDREARDPTTGAAQGLERSTICNVRGIDNLKRQSAYGPGSRVARADRMAQNG